MARACERVRTSSMHDGSEIVVVNVLLLASTSSSSEFHSCVYY